MQTETLPPISIFQAFTKWINQRPGLDARNYGFDRNGIRAYKQELASIARDKKRAIAALGEAMGYTYHPAAMKDALNRAFSGRLSWIDGEFQYTTGQYWPTEYRKAAASVLEAYCNTVRPVKKPAPDTKFETISDIKQANRLAGSHFFDRDSMRFFRSRIVPKIYNGPGGIYFVTSEQYSDETARLYTVRKFNPADADIDTVGDFQKYNSKTEALSEAKRLAKGGTDAAQA